MLDSQNEYFDTQRALSSAKINLLQAQASVLAETGVLTDALDARGFNSDKLEQVELDLARRDDEQIPACSAGVVPEIAIDQEGIFNRLNAEANASDMMQ